MLEFLQFVLLAVVLMQTFVGFGGFLAYGLPMVAVSKSLILLSLVHLGMMLFRRDQLKFDWILLCPIPFLIYEWIHFKFLSPVPWDAGAILSSHLQAYALFLIVCNTVQSPRSIKWTLWSVQVPILTGLMVAIVSYYVFPLWIQDSSRMHDPQYSHGISGLLQDPANLTGLLILFFPFCVLMVIKHMRKGPEWIYYGGIGIVLALGILMSAPRWGLAVMGVVLLILPFFLSGIWEKRIKFLTWAIGMCALATGILWFGTDRVRERINWYLNGAADTTAIQSREVALDAFMDHPIVGNGLGGFATLWESHIEAPVERVSRYPVSLYADVLVELGILGFALGAAFILAIGIRSMRLWKSQPFIRLNQEVARRLQNFPKGHPIHRQLKKEKGTMPSRKAIIGGIVPGLIGLFLYGAFDYGFKLPITGYLVACFLGILASLVRGFTVSSRNRRGWIVLAAVPLMLSIYAGSVGIPRFYSNHITFVSSEKISVLLADPDLIFQDPGSLNALESDLRSTVDLLPSHGDAWTLLGTVSLARLDAELDRPEDIARETMPVLRNAVELAPHSWAAHFNLARGLIISDDSLENAITVLRKAVELAPIRREPKSLLASVLFLKDPANKESLQLLQDVHALYPEYQPAENALRRVTMAGETGSRMGLGVVSGAVLARQFRIWPDAPDRVSAAGLPAPGN